MNRAMGRLSTSLAACLLAVTANVAIGQSITDLEKTRDFAAACQNPDGGFGAGPGQPSSLGTTTAGTRVLKYAGGSVPDVAKCIAFIRSCYDPGTGGFAQKPGATPDVGTTASGLMAIGELKVDDPAMIDGAIGYLSKQATTFPDIRIAVAGLEAVARESTSFPDWTKTVLATRHADGTWGDGATRAFDTGGSAAALLRMGQDLTQRDAVLKTLLEGQLPDGGWSSSSDVSELGATYRVMRCLFMLNSPPDLDRLRAYLARCRLENGSYADKPGGAGSLGSTYTASIVLRWARLLEGLPALVERAGFLPLFDGQSLKGWDGDSSLWSIRDGMLVGQSKGLDHNEFLAHEGKYRDFVLQLSFQLVEGTGNSGVQFRSERLPGHEMKGYQADIGEDFWGCLYDESRRNRVLARASAMALESLNEDGWNHYVVRAMGDEITLSLNGSVAVRYREEEAEIPRDGRIAVQIHAGAPMEARFRDLLIQPLPRPVEDASPTPGFHLKTLSTSPDRRYVVYYPREYNGARRFPVILFLHGAGERGEDGIVPSQVGLGPIVAANPEAFPFVIVFPQAKDSWAGDSADAQAALQALDEVMADSAVDPTRVYLTGLSMGGAGTWDIAARERDRFAAIVPICGPPRKATAGDVRDLPTWIFVGDEDRPGIVQGLRKMASELGAIGSAPRVTEYRGVGHNSWDRAYSEPALVKWLLEQARLSP